MWKKNNNNHRHDDISDAKSNIRSEHSGSQKSIALPDNLEKISINAWKVLAILSLIATMVTYAETMLIPAIPDLIRDFHVSYTTSSWLMTMYLLAGAVMTPIAGKLSDIYGRKKILLIIMIIYAIGVSIAASSSTFYIMLIARAFQGVGMGMFPIAYTMIRSQFPRNKISIGQGIITSMYASGSVIGLVVGGSIIQYYGWHATFLTVIPVSIALLITIWKFVNVKDHRYNDAKDNINSSYLIKDHNKKQKKENSTARDEEYIDIHKKKNNNSINDKKIKRSSLDIKGAVTLTVAIVSILLVFTFLQPSQLQNSITSSSSPSLLTENNTYSLIITISFVILGISSFIGFILIERRASSPLLDLRLMANKTIFYGNMIMLIIGMTMFLVMQTIPVLARSPHPLGFGDSVIEATKIQIPFSIILLIFGPTSGFIVSKMGSKTPMIAGTIITTIGFFAIYALHSTQFLVSIDLAVVSIGLSFAAVGVMNIIILATPTQSMGISTGMTSLVRIIGSAIGPAIAGMFMQSQQQILKISGTTTAMTAAFPASGTYNLIFLTATILSVSSIGFAIMIGRNKRDNNIVLKPKTRVSDT
ncbi:MAG TPA: MFS transporter [Nitrososphaeraceae archaeon]|nr:MFS transporter [Nitrososphaeraceae archaeon]